MIFQAFGAKYWESIHAWERRKGRVKNRLLASRRWYEFARYRLIFQSFEPLSSW